MSTIKSISKLSLTDCVNSFKEKILLNENRIENITKYCINCEVDQNLIRPTAWKIFLGALSKNKSIKEWIEEIANARIEYKRKLKQFCTIKKFAGDPLGINNAVPKKSDPNYEKYIQETELKKLINLDLSRTYQEVDLFLKGNTKNLLANVLFIWSKENEDVSYHQGMNELLAVLYLAFYPFYYKTVTKPKPTKDDILKYFENEETFNKNINDIYIYFHDEDEIQADLYILFCKIMKKGMKELYDPKVIAKDNPDYKKFELFPNKWKDTSDEDVPTFVNRRCALLVKEKLKILDEELFSYFQRIDLNCNIFLQRWLRCLFNHEFKPNEVFILWDAIFAQEDIIKSNSSPRCYDFIFSDYIGMAMIFRMRKELLLMDQTECFDSLFKYPEIEHINELVDISNKVKQAMDDRIKGVDATVYDILFIPRPMMGSGITPHTYNQKDDFTSNKRKKSTNSNGGLNTNKSNVKPNPRKISKGNRENNADNINNTGGGNFIGSALSSLNSITGKIMDVGRKVGETVSEKVSQAIANINYEQNEGYPPNEYNYENNNPSQNYINLPDKVNNIQNQMTEENNIQDQNYSANSQYNVQEEIPPQNTQEQLENSKDNRNALVVIAKLNKIKRKYGMYMERNDRQDLAEIIDFL
ncbi:MAG: TBC domain-containing protein, partial [archaeon]|nr:TBC domain-containing protein [archaeon]